MLRFLLPLFALLLPACALAPHEYPELAPPRAVEIMPIRSDRPVVALVLGAGGARGFAHVGVIKVLEAEGIRPTVVVGSSSGSVVAALYAGGYNAAALEDLALRLEDRDVIDFTLFGPGRVEGEALQDYVNKALRNRSIEALERPFAVIATERATNRMTIFTEYVDGGLTSRVPVPVARRMGAQVVIAVDVSWRGSRDVDAADVAIRPTTPRTRTLDFSARLESIAAGETAARAALPEIRARIAQAERGQRPRGSLAVTSLVTRDW
ncbi:MAG: patatin-like phospholipase family protein [Betaproteobacteria bacterium]|nr:patatin-like phospholipase family protein [Betaproteobacteria bacterium]